MLYGTTESVRSGKVANSQLSQMCHFVPEKMKNEWRKKMKIKSISSVVIFNEYVFAPLYMMSHQHNIFYFFLFLHPNGRYNRVVFFIPNSIFLSVFLFLNPFRNQRRKKTTTHHYVLFYAFAISISSRLPITQ